MIVTTIGSMGTCKTSLVIYLYGLLLKQKEFINTAIFTSHYNPNRNCIPKEKIKHGNTVQVTSRVLDSVIAKMIDEHTDFISSDEKSSNFFLFDEFQFTCESVVKKIIELGKKESVRIFGLNTNFENTMWPSIRKICLESDYIFVVENNDEKRTEKNPEGELRNTNYMTVNGKFDLIFDINGDVDFDACSKESWYEYAVEYFSKKLSEYNGDSKKMLLENPLLKKSFTKLFRLWKAKSIKMNKTNFNRG
jgi:thymidine kinase